MRNKINNTEGVSRGYRLKPETHSLVSRVQKKIDGTKDEVISRACKMLYLRITGAGAKKKSKNNLKKQNLKNKTKKEKK
jgi:hypothetical protein